MKLDPAGAEAEGAEVVPASGLTPARPMMDAIGQVPGHKKPTEIDMSSHTAC